MREVSDWTYGNLRPIGYHGTNPTRKGVFNLRVVPNIALVLSVGMALPALAESRPRGRGDSR